MIKRSTLYAVPLPAFALILALLVLAGCSPSQEGAQVVVYTAVDSSDARGIFADFEKATGVKVLAQFDTEATKTTGLALRLLSEKPRPQADVFWNNELSRTLMLASEGVLAPYESPSAADIPAAWKDPSGMWAAFSVRARVIVYNTDLVSAADAPRTLEDLCDPRWKGRVGIANPLFGTTASHVASLAHLDGEEKAADYLRRLKANGVKVLDGNSVVRDAASSGEILVGLTDTDDVLLGIKREMKIGMVLPDQGEGRGTLVIPNSVMLVAGGPNPDAARRFIDYILSREVERRFADPSLGFIPVRIDEPAPPGMELYSTMKPLAVDWKAVSDLTQPFSRRASQLLLE